MLPEMKRAGLFALLLLAGCWRSHAADVVAPRVEPPAVVVRHSGRLWIELAPLTEERQCLWPSEQPRRSEDPKLASDSPLSAASPVCFDGVREALAGSLEGALWPAFPSVAVRGRADELARGDWVLLIDADLSVLPPDDHGAGWAAGLGGKWRLVRDGLPVHEGTIAERSRGDFAYGRQLAFGAAEAMRSAVGRLAESVAALPDASPGVPAPNDVVARR